MNVPIITPEHWREPGAFDVTILRTPDLLFRGGTARMKVHLIAADRPGLYEAIWQMREAEALAFTLPLPAKARMIVTSEPNGSVTYQFTPEGWPQPAEEPKPQTCPCCGQKVPR